MLLDKHFAQPLHLFRNIKEPALTFAGEVVVAIVDATARCTWLQQPQNSKHKTTYPSFLSSFQNQAIGLRRRGNRLIGEILKCKEPE